ncbi:glycoside hydrolase family 28 protein [Terriglobus sp. 2YAB30_2]|uniref:glycoside hydrolase family 28 protein n=1 Tax=Terriglobus sp. 2YAB30_2 TaxID=3233023 RepID=UPI003F94A58E
MSKSLFALALPILMTGAAYATPVCNVTQYGAKADGATKNTAAIQKAIDDCSAKKGTVVLSGGTFVSGPLVLKSNITFRVEKGTTLLGSADHDDYPKMEVLRAAGRQSLISSDHAENITITGGGIIDGNGESWWKEARATTNAGFVGGDTIFRPRLAVFNYSKHIKMEDITFQNSPSWQVVPYYCDDVIIRNVRILAPEHSPNSDAVDPFSTSNMIIDHLYADVGDDNIAIKSGLVNSPGPDAPSKNITITDCTFMHGHGLSIGSEIAGGAQNIRAERIHFDGTDQALRIKANRDRGADVSNIVFKDIDIKNVGMAILISEYYPKVLPPEGDAAQPVTRLTPLFHDITIENVTATNAKTTGVIIGLPESPVKNVVLKNVHLEGGVGFRISDATVTAENFTVKAEKGEAITVLPSAKLTKK